MEAARLIRAVSQETGEQRSEEDAAAAAAIATATAAQPARSGQLNASTQVSRADVRKLQNSSSAAVIVR